MYGYRVVFCLFVCLGFFHLKFFHSCGDLRPLSSEDSFAYHTYCNTGHPFITVISDDPYVTPISIAERLAVEYAEYYFSYS